MSSLSGKIVEPRADVEGDVDFVLGERLRALRKSAGLTQFELSKKLKISQHALSSLEGRADIQVSTIRKYVEALGATLQINAAFSADTPIVFRIADAFDIELVNDNQLVLPILGDDNFRPQRDVVLSVKPKYSTQILTGKKTVEVRRRFPVNVPKGTLAYIYSTTPDKALVGFAEIESVTKKSVSAMWQAHRQETCITKRDFDSYFSGQEFGFALRFRRAKPFKESIDLAQLRERFGFEPPQSFLYAKPLLRKALRYELTELSH